MPEANKPGRGPLLGPSLWRLASLGLDLAVAVGGFTLLGWFADRHWQVFPRYTVVGAVLGLIGGMYNLIRQALNASRDAAQGKGSGDAGRDDEGRDR